MAILRILLLWRTALGSADGLLAFSPIGQIAVIPEAGMLAVGQAMTNQIWLVSTRGSLVRRHNDPKKRIRSIASSDTVR